MNLEEIKMKEREIKKFVREAYTKIAKQDSSCCANVNLCYRNTDLEQDIGKKIGYTKEELSKVPEGANLGLGCGNPVALTSLREGETVLDLGSGAGLDCFLASSKVGEKGRVIGVDMTPDMIEKAKENSEKGNYKNVEFRLGEIENLPVADNSVDVVISNCVINLSPNKRRVFQEIFRVLKPGGRIAISDIALIIELPKKIQDSIEAYASCVGGAILIDKYRRIIETSGLKDIVITVKNSSTCINTDKKVPIGRDILDGLGENESLEGYVASIYIEGRKENNK
jgi:SAM-dependent methyltransferase